MFIRSDVNTSIQLTEQQAIRPLIHTKTHSFIGSLIQKDVLLFLITADWKCGHISFIISLCFYECPSGKSAIGMNVGTSVLPGE